MKTTETLQTKFSDAVLKFQVQYDIYESCLVVKHKVKLLTLMTKCSVEKVFHLLWAVNESFTPVLGKRNNPACSNKLLMTPGT